MAEEIEIEVKKEEEEYPEFKTPEGLDTSDLKEGEEKEILAKIRKKPDGVLCLIEVDGFPLGHEEEDDYADEQEEDEVASDYASQVRARAAQSGLM